MLLAKWVEFIEKSKNLDDFFQTLLFVVVFGEVHLSVAVGLVAGCSLVAMPPKRVVYVGRCGLILVCTPYCVQSRAPTLLD